MLFLSGIVLGFMGSTLKSEKPWIELIWKVLLISCSVGCFYHSFGK